MPENLRVGVEISFNIFYLVCVWGIVALMFARRGRALESNQKLVSRFIAAFALLALGDTGHVGFRVIAYLTGGLEANSTLVGFGAASTAFTVTIFYMLMVDIWRIRFNKPLNWFAYLLLAAGLVRMVVMLFPQNQWNLLVAPYGWNLARNAILTFQGLGVMALILKDAISQKDRIFTWVGIMIALSFAFYAPVIIWVRLIPLLGMLMIPKTCAYLAVALIAYWSFIPRDHFSTGKN